MTDEPNDVKFDMTFFGIRLHLQKFVGISLDSFDRALMLDGQALVFIGNDGKHLSIGSKQWIKRNNAGQAGTFHDDELVKVVGLEIPSLTDSSHTSDVIRVISLETGKEDWVKPKEISSYNRALRATLAEK